MSRSFFATEVIQTSEMDCGPACLKSVLAGFGISASYGRLREACQTDVDGTNIDVIEDVANQIGLTAEQMLVPVDYFLAPDAELLPALLVVSLPHAPTHFVVVWRQLGQLVQVMDPASGRRWMPVSEVLAKSYQHTAEISRAEWEEWAREGDGLTALHTRLARLGARSQLESVLQAVLQDPSWRPFAALDAASLLVASLVDSGAVDRGREAAVLIDRLYAQALEAPERIPKKYWTMSADDGDGAETISIRGLIAVRLERPEGAREVDEFDDRTQVQVLPPELVAALDEAPEQPTRDLLRMILKDGALTPLMIGLALALAAVGVLVEAVLFRSFLSIGARLGSPEQRLLGIGALLVFLVALLGLKLPLAGGVARMGRHLELRFRATFLEKIPKLGDRYFASRLISDMADRSHSIQWLHALPHLGARIVEALAALALTTAAIAWLHPASAPIAIACAVLVTAVPLLAHRALSERDLKVRTLAASVSRYYLDALLGLVAVRTHGAERALTRMHEGLLAEWARAGLSLLAAMVGLTGFQALVGTLVAVVIVWSYLATGGDRGPFLLLVYWSVALPAYGAQVASLLWQYPAHRNVALRLAEPLGAPEDHAAPNQRQAEPVLPGDEAPNVSVRLDRVTVVAGGHKILEEIDLEIEPGAHVAIVGRSGAGKSSLVGLLLGWHRPTEGRVLINGAPLEGDVLHALRRHTAWIDPSVQIWNRTLLENLQYGSPPVSAQTLGAMMREAELIDVLEDLPSGLATPLGEGGGFLSGGQGQRVRIGRALLRPGVKLAILDEAFRGLDRSMRAWMVQRVRKLWADSTLIFITHDVELSKAFDRVVVVDAGRIIEDEAPAALLQDPDSAYSDMITTEREVLELLRSSDQWQRMKLSGGKLAERSGEVMT